MSEILEIYNLKGDFLYEQERKEFYADVKEEFEKTGKVTKKVKTIRLLLMNSKGRIYVQKRSKSKKMNAGLYDKSVGGHVSKKGSFDLSLIRECAEELGFPLAVVILDQFEDAVETTNIDVIAIAKEIDSIERFESKRILKDGSIYVQPYYSKFYLGYYDGAIQFRDGESSGIEIFSLEELQEEIENNPERFTEDLKWMLKKYESYLKIK